MGRISRGEGSRIMQERDYPVSRLCSVEKMTRKVCNRNHSNESKTMRDVESQMQRALDQEDLMILTMASIEDLELRYKWRRTLFNEEKVTLAQQLWSHGWANCYRNQLSFCCDKDHVQINIQGYTAHTAATTTNARWPADRQHKQRLRRRFAQTFLARVADVRGSLGKMFRVEFRTRSVNFKQR